MKTNKFQFLVILFLGLVKCEVWSASESPVLMKILQAVDVTTNDDNLFEVTLQLLKSLCVCMQNTLKAKEDQFQFNGDSNSLPINQDSDNEKVLDLYKRIYNNTCFNLRNELVDKLNNKRQVDLHDNLNMSCFNYVNNHLSDGQEKNVRMKNSGVQSNLQNMLYKTLIETRSQHNYTLNKSYLYNKQTKLVDNVTKQILLVFITLKPKNNNTQTKDGKHLLEYEDVINLLNDTNEHIMIHIYNTLFYDKELDDHPRIIKMSKCNMYSLYTYLTKKEEHNEINIIKLFKKTDTIKIFLNITANKNEDFLDICCLNSTQRYKSDMNAYHHNIQHNDTIDHNQHNVIQNYKKTISKIKDLVKLYDEKIKGYEKYDIDGRIQYSNSSECIGIPEEESIGDNINILNTMFKVGVQNENISNDEYLKPLRIRNTEITNNKYDKSKSPSNLKEIIFNKLRSDLETRDLISQSQMRDTKDNELSSFQSPEVENNWMNFNINRNVNKKKTRLLSGHVSNNNKVEKKKRTYAYVIPRDKYKNGELTGYPINKIGISQLIADIGNPRSNDAKAITKNNEMKYLTRLTTHKSNEITIYSPTTEQVSFHITRDKLIPDHKYTADQIKTLKFIETTEIPVNIKPRYQESTLKSKPNPIEIEDFTSNIKQTFTQNQIYSFREKTTLLNNSIYLSSNKYLSKISKALGQFVSTENNMGFIQTSDSYLKKNTIQRNLPIKTGAIYQSAKLLAEPNIQVTDDKNNIPKLNNINEIVPSIQNFTKSTVPEVLQVARSSLASNMPDSRIPSIVRDVKKPITFTTDSMKSISTAKINLSNFTVNMESSSIQNNQIFNLKFAQTDVEKSTAKDQSSVIVTEITSRIPNTASNPTAREILNLTTSTLKTPIRFKMFTSSNLHTTKEMKSIEVKKSFSTKSEKGISDTISLKTPTFASAHQKILRDREATTTTVEMPIKVSKLDIVSTMSNKEHLSKSTLQISGNDVLKRFFKSNATVIQTRSTLEDNYFMSSEINNINTSTESDLLLQFTHQILETTTTLPTTAIRSQFLIKPLLERLPEIINLTHIVLPKKEGSSTLIGYGGVKTTKKSSISTIGTPQLTLYESDSLQNIKMPPHFIFSPNWSEINKINVSESFIPTTENSAKFNSPVIISVTNESSTLEKRTLKLREQRESQNFKISLKLTSTKNKPIDTSTYILKNFSQIVKSSNTKIPTIIDTTSSAGSPTTTTQMDQNVFASHDIVTQNVIHSEMINALTNIERPTLKIPEKNTLDHEATILRSSTVKSLIKESISSKNYDTGKHLTERDSLTPVTSSIVPIITLRIDLPVNITETTHSSMFNNIIKKPYNKKLITKYSTGIRNVKKVSVISAETNPIYKRLVPTLTQNQVFTVRNEFDMTTDKKPASYDTNVIREITPRTEASAIYYRTVPIIITTYMNQKTSSSHPTPIRNLQIPISLNTDYATDKPTSLRIRSNRDKIFFSYSKITNNTQMILNTTPGSITNSPLMKSKIIEAPKSNNNAGYFSDISEMASLLTGITKTPKATLSTKVQIERTNNITATKIHRNQWNDAITQSSTADQLVDTSISTTQIEKPISSAFGGKHLFVTQNSIKKTSDSSTTNNSKNISVMSTTNSTAQNNAALTSRETEVSKSVTTNDISDIIFSDDFNIDIKTSASLTANPTTVYNIKNSTITTTANNNTHSFVTLTTANSNTHLSVTSTAIRNIQTTAGIPSAHKDIVVTSTKNNTEYTVKLAIDSIRETPSIGNTNTTMLVTSNYRIYPIPTKKTIEQTQVDSKVSGNLFGNLTENSITANTLISLNRSSVTNLTTNSNTESSATSPENVDTKTVASLTNNFTNYILQHLIAHNKTEMLPKVTVNSIAGTVVTALSNNNTKLYGCSEIINNITQSTNTTVNSNPEKLAVLKNSISDALLFNSTENIELPATPKTRIGTIVYKTLRRNNLTESPVISAYNKQLSTIPSIANSDTETPRKINSDIYFNSTINTIPKTLVTSIVNSDTKVSGISLNKASISDIKSSLSTSKSTSVTLTENNDTITNINLFLYNSTEPTDHSTVNDHSENMYNEMSRSLKTNSITNTLYVSSTPNSDIGTHEKISHATGISKSYTSRGNTKQFPVDFSESDMTEVPVGLSGHFTGSITSNKVRQKIEMTATPFVKHITEKTINSTHKIKANTSVSLTKSSVLDTITEEKSNRITANSQTESSASLISLIENRDTIATNKEESLLSANLINFKTEIFIDKPKYSPEKTTSSTKVKTTRTLTIPKTKRFLKVAEKVLSRIINRSSNYTSVLIATDKPMNLITGVPTESTLRHTSIMPTAVATKSIPITFLNTNSIKQTPISSVKTLYTRMPIIHNTLSSNMIPSHITAYDPLEEDHLKVNSAQVTHTSSTFSGNIKNNFSTTANSRSYYTNTPLIAKDVHFTYKFITLPDKQIGKPPLKLRQNITKSFTSTANHATILMEGHTTEISTNRSILRLLTKTPDTSINNQFLQPAFNAKATRGPDTPISLTNSHLIATSANLTNHKIATLAGSRKQKKKLDTNSTKYIINIEPSSTQQTIDIPSTSKNHIVIYESTMRNHITYRNVKLIGSNQKTKTPTLLKSIETPKRSARSHIKVTTNGLTTNYVTETMKGLNRSNMKIIHTSLPSSHIANNPSEPTTNHMADNPSSSPTTHATGSYLISTTSSLADTPSSSTKINTAETPSSSTTIHTADTPSCLLTTHVTDSFSSSTTSHIIDIPSNSTKTYVTDTHSSSATSPTVDIPPSLTTSPLADTPSSPATNPLANTRSSSSITHLTDRFSNSTTSHMVDITSNSSKTYVTATPSSSATSPMADTPSSSATNPMAYTPLSSETSPMVNIPPSLTTSPMADTPLSSATSPMADTPSSLATNPMAYTPLSSATSPMVNFPPSLTTSPMAATSSSSATSPMTDTSTSSATSPMAGIPSSAANTPMADIPSSAATSPMADTPLSSATSPMADIPTSSATSPMVEIPPSLTTSPMADTSSSTAKSPMADIPSSAATSPMADTPLSSATSPLADSPSSSTTSLMVEIPPSLTTSSMADTPTSSATSPMADIPSSAANTPMADIPSSAATSPIAGTTPSLTTNPIADTSSSSATSPMANIPSSAATSPMADTPLSSATSPMADIPTSSATSPMVEIPLSLTTSPMVDTSSSTAKSPMADIPSSAATSPMADTPLSSATSPMADTPSSSATSLMVEIPPSLTTSSMADTPTSSATSPMADIPSSAENNPMADTLSSAATSPMVDTPSNSLTKPVADTPSSSATSPIVNIPPNLTTSPIADTPSSAATSPMVDTPSSSITKPMADTPSSSVTNPMAYTPLSSLTKPMAIIPSSSATSPMADIPSSAATSPMADTPSSSATSLMVEIPPSLTTSSMADTSTSSATSSMADIPSSAATSPMADTPSSSVTNPMAYTPLSSLTKPMADIPSSSATSPMADIPSSVVTSPMVDTSSSSSTTHLTDRFSNSTTSHMVDITSNSSKTYVTATPSSSAASPMADTPSSSATNPMAYTPLSSETSPMVNIPPSLTTSPMADTPLSSATSPMADTPSSLATNPMAYTPLSSATSPMVNFPPSLTTSPMAATSSSSATSPMTDTSTSSATSPMAGIPSSAANTPMADIPSSAAISPMAKTPLSSLTKPMADIPASLATSPMADSPSSSSRTHLTDRFSSSTTSHRADIPSSLATSSNADTLSSEATSPMADIPSSAATSPMADIPSSLSTTHLKDSFSSSITSPMVDIPSKTYVSDTPLSSATNPMAYTPLSSATSPMVNIPLSLTASPMGDTSSSSATSPMADIPSSAATSPMADTPLSSATSPMADIPSSAATSPMADISSSAAKSPLADTPSSSATSPMVGIPPSLTTSSMADTPKSSATSPMADIPSSAATSPMADTPSSSVTNPMAYTPLISQTKPMADIPSSSATIHMADIPSSAATSTMADTPSSSSRTHLTDRFSRSTTSHMADIPSSLATISIADIPSSAATSPMADFPSSLSITHLKDSLSSSITSHMVDIPSNSSKIYVTDTPSSSATSPMADTPSSLSTTHFTDRFSNSTTSHVVDITSNSSETYVKDTPSSSATNPVADTRSSSATSPMADTPSILATIPKADTPLSSVTSAMAHIPSSAATSPMANTPSSSVTNPMADTPSSLATSSMVNILPSLTTSPIADNLSSSSRNHITESPSSSTITCMPNSPSSSARSKITESPSRSTEVYSPSSSIKSHITENPSSSTIKYMTKSVSSLARSHNTESLSSSTISHTTDSPSSSKMNVSMDSLSSIAKNHVTESRLSSNINHMTDSNLNLASNHITTHPTTIYHITETKERKETTTSSTKKFMSTTPRNRTITDTSQIFASHPTRLKSSRNLLTDIIHGKVNIPINAHKDYENSNKMKKEWNEEKNVNKTTHNYEIRFKKAKINKYETTVKFSNETNNKALLTLPRTTSRTSELGATDHLSNILYIDESSIAIEKKLTKSMNIIVGLDIGNNSTEKDSFNYEHYRTIASNIMSTSQKSDINNIKDSRIKNINDNLISQNKSDEIKPNTSVIFVSDTPFTNTDKEIFEKTRRDNIDIRTTNIKNQYKYPVMHFNKETKNTSIVKDKNKISTIGSNVVVYKNSTRKKEDENTITGFVEESYITDVHKENLYKFTEMTTVAIAGSHFSSLPSFIANNITIRTNLHKEAGEMLPGSELYFSTIVRRENSTYGTKEKGDEYGRFDKIEVTDWWLDDMYLKVRLPLPINSNPGMVFPRRHFAKMEEVADLGALFIDDLLDYKEMLDRGELPLERATCREKGQPLCMEQFYRLLGVCRIPEVGRDRLEFPPIRGNADEGEELVVAACRNYFYPIPVKAVDRGRLTPGEIQAQLLHCMVDAAGAPPAPRVGLLTSMNRDQWARARETLIKDENNRANLELISRALCILCLDEGGGDRADADADTNAMLRAMHGAGTGYHSANRWFDKTVQLIISQDGTVGMCYEHSAAEGVAVVRLAERALARAAVAARPAPPPALLPAPPPLAWRLPHELHRTIDQAARDLDRAISNLDHRVYTYRGYGREFMKSCRTSPDVYIQLALQYAYYKMYGYLVTTYESASLRRFRDGRVDNIRSAHASAHAWAAAMCTAESSPLNESHDDGQKKVSFNLYGDQKKLELFEDAARKQTDVMEANILGRGIDNHLLGLREAARETLGELPPVFTDATYKQMIEFKLSTSQVATTTEGMFMGYGAVVPDGYGCSYNPKRDCVIFCISSFTSSSVTNTEAFRQALEESLNSMQLMFQAKKLET